MAPCRACSAARASLVSGLRERAIRSRRISRGRVAPRSPSAESRRRPRRSEAGVVERHLTRHAPFDRNGFTALSTAFLADGAVIELGDRVVLDRPIEVVFASDGRDGERVGYPRLLVVCGRETEASIVESYVSLDGAPTLTNAVAEIVLGDGAKLAHVRVVRDGARGSHVATTAVEQARDSRYASAALALRASFFAPRARRAHRGRRRAVLARRALHRRREGFRRQPHLDRARRAARHQPRALQRRLGRGSESGLQRQGDRAAERAEVRCAADEQEPAALGARGDRHQAGAADPRGRREVRPRRGDRTAGPGSRCSICRAGASATRRGEGFSRVASPTRSCSESRRMWRARPSRKPCSSGSRKSSWREHESGRGNGKSAGRARALRRRASAARLSDPAADRARQAARLPRQCGDQSEAPGGDRFADALLHGVQRQHSPRHPPPERGGDACVRACPLARAWLHQRRGGSRDRLRARHHRGHQPRRPQLRTRLRQAGRRNRHHGHGAPFEHRAVADPRRADRRAPARRADRRRGRSCSSTRSRRCSPARPG